MRHYMKYGIPAMFIKNMLWLWLYRHIIDHQKGRQKSDQEVSAGGVKVLFIGRWQIAAALSQMQSLADLDTSMHAHNS